MEQDSSLDLQIYEENLAEGIKRGRSFFENLKKQNHSLERLISELADYKNRLAACNWLLQYEPSNAPTPNELRERNMRIGLQPVGTQLTWPEYLKKTAEQKGYYSELSNLLNAYVTQTTINQTQAAITKELIGN